MNINYKQSQFELFPGSPGSSTETGKPRYLFAHLTLSIENLIVLGIVIVMTLLFSFSLGVEKGKRITGVDQIENKRIAKPLTKKSKIANAQVAKTKEPVPIQAAETAKIQTREAFSDTQIIDKTQAAVIEDKMLSLMPAIVETKNPVALADVQSYTIQVASYKGDKYALKEADTLKEEGFDTQVLKKGDYFIVCVGKFADKDDANQTLGKLKKKYNDLLVRSL